MLTIDLNIDEFKIEDVGPLFHQLILFSERAKFSNGIEYLILDLLKVKHLMSSYFFVLPAYMNAANDARKNEFICARLLSQAVLYTQFECLQNVTSPNHKLPIWPNEFLGCISHSKNKIVVAISDQYRALGIDIEHWVNDDFAEESQHLILTAQDQQHWSNESPLLFYHFLTLAFSLKESIYKMVYPKSQSYIDFLEASIDHIDFRQQKIHLQFTTELEHRFGLMKSYEGVWQNYDEFIITCVASMR